MNIIVRKPTDAEKAFMESRPTWTCHVPEFECYYSVDETCLITEGEVTVEYKGGSTKFGAGDLVILPHGLSCTWKVTKPVKKHYLEVMDVYVRKPTEAEKAEMMKMPLWSCGITSFACTYGSEETCLILEGDASVSFGDGYMVRFGAGDLVIFPQGLACTWRVDVPVKKHYVKVRR